MSEDPVKDCLAAGMQALLRGDTAERDRQVGRARKIMDAQQAAPKVTIGAAEIVARLLLIAERQAGRALTKREWSAIAQNPKAFGEYLIKIGYKIPADIAAGTFATT
jgi:hypothetical protein